MDEAKGLVVAAVTCALVFLLGGGSAHAQLCGDATGNEETTAADALVTLRAALGLNSCELCVCDVDDSGEIVAADALALLSLAVGESIDLDCPSCVTTTTTLEPVRVECGHPAAEAPACDGYCGLNGLMCVESPPGSGNCQCIFGSTCGTAAGPPACAGACDAGWICKDIGGTCRCVF